MKTISILLCILVSFPIYAQNWNNDNIPEVPENNEEINEDSVKVFEIGGFPHLCFDMDASKKLLDMYTKFPKLQMKVVALEELVGVQADQIIKMEQIKSIDEQKIQVLTDETVALQKKLEERDAWWRSPWLWFAVGCVLATGATIGISYAIND